MHQSMVVFTLLDQVLRFNNKKFAIEENISTNTKHNNYNNKALIPKYCIDYVN